MRLLLSVSETLRLHLSERPIERGPNNLRQYLFVGFESAFRVAPKGAALYKLACAVLPDNIAKLLKSVLKRANLLWTWTPLNESQCLFRATIIVRFAASVHSSHLPINSSISSA